MIESGRVIALEQDSVWVETSQKSSCGTCVAQKSCGQNLLASLYPTRVNQLKVSTLAFDGRKPELDDWVDFAVPDHALLSGSITVYMLPLSGLILGALAGSVLFTNELLSIAMGMAGIGLGILLARQLDSRRDPLLVLPTMLGLSAARAD